ncbi:MAG: PD40 domain-containing protein [Planctomycetes bacterium]|nr:PD40 domain-containing protein [Planctomycetota bacterium]
MRVLSLAGAFPFLLLALPAQAGTLHSGDTKVLSFKKGLPLVGSSSVASVSRNGRWIAFTSDRTNLTSPPGNGQVQVLLLDRSTNKYDLASVSTLGVQASSDCSAPKVSANGRYVVFVSSAPTLVAGDVLGHQDVFRHDRKTGATVRVSLTHDNKEPNDDCHSPSVSASGRYVVFESDATNLVPVAGNGKFHIYVRDLEAGTLERVSLGSGGVQGNDDSRYASISGDGRLVAFYSEAANLGCPAAQQVYVRDRKNGTTELISRGHGGQTPDGASFAPRISEDGRYVAFPSYASNLTNEDKAPGKQDVFVFDRKKEKMKQYVVKHAQKALAGSAMGISSNGRYILIQSTEVITLREAPHSFYRLHHVDRETGKVRMFSVNSQGEAAKESCLSGALSGNGAYGVFSSQATNLGQDKDANTDIFIHCK